MQMNPWFEEIKINYDGSALGSPGKAGLGAVVWDHSGEFLGVITNGLGITTAFEAECKAVIESLIWAVNKY
ncbi:hypothetical protein GIB67_013260 [Kingdonia uniflora]|uniref:RNase H type-1 domain-containing protein n=1 Tax=Kingdonia uniflora TaxID=39325 RepID=A0A7J7N680_9MAGN|nr:hypothetical protein GIB67_013260 [Kingdonia uniflora]